MTDFRRKYKEKTLNFGATAESRLIRVEKHEESRRKQRERTFNKNRNIPNSSHNTPSDKETQVPTVVEDRLTRLTKWKAERERRKKVDQTKKRPPFKVGVVHHRVYSPITKDGVSSQPEPPASNLSRRITRATEKRLMAKAASKKSAAKASVKDSAAGKERKEEKREKSFAPSNYKFKAPVGLPKMPLFGRIPLEISSKEELDNFVISPMRKLTPRQESALQTWIVDDVKSKTVKSPECLVTEVEDANHTTNSSIETIQLRLSSDDQEILNCSYEEKRQLRKSKTPDKSSEISISCPLNRTMPPSTQSGSPCEPAFFSPYVVLSRGKSNARKEQQTRRGLGFSPSENIPTKDTVMKNLNISLEEEERTSQYFLFILNKQIDRLTELCDKWAEIKMEPNITEDAQYQVNQAVGQTTLLVNKKFERFRGLVNDCETGKGEMLVTCRDLQGFWDMMYMEVKDCDLRFEKLEKLRSQGWVEEQPVIKAVTKKKAPVKKKAVASKQSSLRSLISERRKYMAQKCVDGSHELNDINTSALHEKMPEEVIKSPIKSYTRRSKSIGPREVKSTPMKKEGARLSLLQRVQLSETSKRLRSPLAMMKISQLCKTPEVQLDDTISYVNSDQSPGKSILKRTNESADVSRAKPTHTVNFDDQIVLNEVPVDEETRTKLDLAAAFAKIDSIDFDYPNEQPAVSVERRLIYDDESSDESQSTRHDIEEHLLLDTHRSKFMDENHIGLPVISIQLATPLRESPPVNNRRTPSPKKYLRRQSCSDKDSQKTVKIANETSESATSDLLRKTLQRQVSMHGEPESDDDGSTRILRNRTVTSKDTPNGKRRSVKVSNIQEIEHKENKSPIRTRRKSSLKISVTDEGKDHSKIDLEDAIDKISLDETFDKRRRSSRKSVKFTVEKECAGCENGPVLPMTPHIRRNKARSSESKKRSTLAQESVLWAISEKPPERIRRSQSRKV